jgi:hypothetical protein
MSGLPTITKSEAAAILKAAGGAGVVCGSCSDDYWTFLQYAITPAALMKASSQVLPLERFRSRNYHSSKKKKTTTKKAPSKKK